MSKNSTGILLTTGPRLCEEQHFIQLLRCGLSNYRVHLGKKQRNNLGIFKNIRNAEKKENISCNIFLDIPSARTRIEYIVPMDRETLWLKSGDFFKVIWSDLQYKNDGYIYVKISNLEKHIKNITLLDRLLIKDGNYKAVLLEIQLSCLLFQCKTDVKLSNSISCLWPDSDFEYEIIDDYTISFFEECKKNLLQPDGVILSFVNCAQDIIEAKEYIKSVFLKKDILFISKIETRKAIQNLDEIIDASDLIMIGRGDLAPQIDFIRLPYAQKIILEKAKQSKTPCIVATQFLDELAQQNRIYSPELNDIFYTIHQDADLIMLAGEGAASPNSEKCINLLEKIITNELGKDFFIMKKEIKKTCIMATAGPTLENTMQFEHAIKIGVSDFRIHMGLRSRDFCSYFFNVRKAAENIGKDVNILIDLPSSRPRVGKMEEKEVSFGEVFNIFDSNNHSKYGENYLPLPGLDNFIKKISLGERVMFRDGRIIFKVIDLDHDNLKVECTKADLSLKEMSSCNFPDSNIDYAPIEDIDVEYFKKMYSMKLKPDWAAISFATNVEQINEVKTALADVWGEDNNIKIMCKIENMKGVENIDLLIEFSDGIMVARGDLLPNIDPILLPRIQLEIVNKCNIANKKVVVATEFFERFAETGIINRAELSDVALAYREGSDAIMLARETGNTKYVFDCLSLIQKLLDKEYDYDIKGSKNI